MFTSLFGEIGILDILVILNYFETYKANKNIKKLQKIELYALLKADDDLDEIVSVLKELRK